MLCKKCNKEIREDANFCGFCGNKVEKESLLIKEETFCEETVEEMVSENNEETFLVPEEEFKIEDNEKKKKKKEYVVVRNETTSIVLGSVALVLAYFFNIITLPISIIGLVFDYLVEKETYRKGLGFYLNTFSIIIATVMFIVSLNTTVDLIKEFKDVYNQPVEVVKNEIENRQDLLPLEEQEKQLKELEKEIEETVEEKTKQQKSSVRDITGNKYMLYSVPEDWQPIQETMNEETFSFTIFYNEDINALLRVTSFVKENITEEDLENDIQNTLGTVYEKINFVTNNHNGRIVWAKLGVENNIAVYYHITENNIVHLFEVQTENAESLEKVHNDMLKIFSSIENK